MTVSFTIPGPPKGKQRPRVVRKGKYTRTYTPKQTVEYEKMVQACYEEQVGRAVLSIPIRAIMVFYFPIPKSESKKRRELLSCEQTFHMKKPDIDNCIKIVTDALNGIAYKDDSAISEVIASKVYGKNPRVEVILEELDETAEV